LYTEQSRYIVIERKQLQGTKASQGRTTGMDEWVGFGGGRGRAGRGGPFGAGGPRGGFGPRGRRMRRGDIRTALLAVLSEGPGHGYDVIQTLEEKSGGIWKPSPGSVYPTLQLLEDEGLVRSSERDGKRVYEITPAGRAEAQRRIEAAGGTPWDLAAQGGGGGAGNLMRAVAGVHVAAKQLLVVGNAEQLEQGAAIVADARKKLYGLLAAD
jgi:DNA-binding PadR family transcriptional regulator